MKHNKRVILLIITICLLSYFGPSIIGGYTYSERSAIRKSYPYQNGNVIFSKDFDGRKLVIWDTGNAKYIKLINRKLGIFYRTDIVSDIVPITTNEQMWTTWSASLTKEKTYDTVFGVEVLDDKITQIIISNDGGRDKLESKEEIKRNSSFYIELPVEDGYTAYFSNLSIDEAGGFVFRGLDESGQIISVSQ